MAAIVISIAAVSSLAYRAALANPADVLHRE
jgi:hypothetical protein